jgi:hypothetical protein
MSGPHPGIFEVWFRYDSPVVIVSMTWHETRDPFVDLLCAHLGTSYHDNMGSVSFDCFGCEGGTEGLQILRVDASLLGWKAGLDVYLGGNQSNRTSVEDIEVFLGKYETAKIVVILDTHCENNGRFIYGCTEGTTDYKACSLKEVRPQSIPSHIH